MAMRAPTGTADALNGLQSMLSGMQSKQTADRKERELKDRQAKQDKWVNEVRGWQTDAHNDSEEYKSFTNNLTAGNVDINFKDNTYAIKTKDANGNAVPSEYKKLKPEMYTFADKDNNKKFSDYLVSDDYKNNVSFSGSTTAGTKALEKSFKASNFTESQNNKTKALEQYKQYVLTNDKAPDKDWYNTGAMKGFGINEPTADMSTYFNAYAKNKTDMKWLADQRAITKDKQNLAAKYTTFNNGLANGSVSYTAGSEGKRAGYYKDGNRITLDANMQAVAEKYNTDSLSKHFYTKDGTYDNFTGLRDGATKALWQKLKFDKVKQANNFNTQKNELDATKFIDEINALKPGKAYNDRVTESTKKLQSGIPESYRKLTPQNIIDKIASFKETIYSPTATAEQRTQAEKGIHTATEALDAQSKIKDFNELTDKFKGSSFSKLTYINREITRLQGKDETPPAPLIDARDASILKLKTDQTKKITDQTKNIKSLDQKIFKLQSTPLKGTEENVLLEIKNSSKSREDLNEYVRNIDLTPFAADMGDEAAVAEAVKRLRSTGMSDKAIQYAISRAVDRHTFSGDSLLYKNTKGEESTDGQAILDSATDYMNAMGYSMIAGKDGTTTVSMDGTGASGKWSHNPIKNIADVKDKYLKGLVAQKQAAEAKVTSLRQVDPTKDTATSALEKINEFLKTKQESSYSGLNTRMHKDAASLNKIFGNGEYQFSISSGDGLSSNVQKALKTSRSAMLNLNKSNSKSVYNFDNLPKQSTPFRLPSVPGAPGAEGTSLTSVPDIQAMLASRMKTVQYDLSHNLITPERYREFMADMVKYKRQVYNNSHRR